MGGKNIATKPSLHFSWLEIGQLGKLNPLLGGEQQLETAANTQVKEQQPAKSIS